MKTKISILTMLTGFACLIFSTASLAQTDDYQKGQKSVFHPVMSQDNGGTPGLWTGAVHPCGTTQFDEVEDYAINIRADINVWTGAVSDAWNNSNNWSLGHKPYLSEDVVITSDGFHPPVVSGSQEACRDMLIEAGAGVNVGNGVLSVFGDADIHGNLSLTNTTAKVYIYGDVVWHSGSTGSMTGSATIDCEGDWDFRAGANVQFNSGFVEFSGDGFSFIRSYEANCQIYRLRNYKSGSDYLGVSALSTQDLHIHGNIYNYAGSNFRFASNHKLILDGFFNNMNGNFEFLNGTLQFNGNPSVALKPTEGDYLNNLIINTTSPLQLASDYSGILQINGNLEIIGGSFVPGSFQIIIKGYWYNTVGDAGFVEDGSRVTFNGSGHQYIYTDETFNILEADLGGAIKPASNNVICNIYDWTSGAIDVFNGTFTALDLQDDAIYGGFWVNPGGVINLTNDGFVDLKGELHNFGGTINVSGTISWWPYNADGVVVMTDGVIDFKTCGITIKDNSYDLSVNITGGKIRTVGNFINERSDVDLSQLDLELYGTGTRSLSLSGNNTLNDLEINKSGAKGNPEIKPTDRNGNLLPESGKANQINLASDAHVTNVDLTSGSFYLNGHEMTVAHRFWVYEGGAFYMDNPSDILNVATNTSDWFRFLPGSEVLLSGGIVNLGGWIYTHLGCSFTATVDNTIRLIKPAVTLGAGLANNEPSARYGNIVVDSDGTPKFLDASATHPFIINGDLTINAGDVLEIQNKTLILHGNFIDHPGSELIVYDSYKTGKDINAYITNPSNTPYEKSSKGGYFEVDNFLAIYGTLDVGDGEVLAHDFFEVAGTGSLLIDGGSFICDVPFSEIKAWNYIRGNFEMSEGLFEVTNNSIRFEATSSSNISGGTLRSGRSFSAIYPGTFSPTGGTLEINCVDDDHGVIVLDADESNTLYNVVINNQNGSETIFWDTHITNDFTILNGSARCSQYDYQNIYIGGNWTDEIGGFEPDDCTVFFEGPNKSQITTDATFYNLTIDKTYPHFDALEIMSVSVTVLNDLNIIDGTLELNSNTVFTVGNNVDIALNAGLNAGGMDTNIEIYVGGNWTNLNTSYNTIYGYTPGGETITFNGAADQIMTTAAAIEDFNNFAVNKPGGALRPAGNLQILGNFDIFAGDFSSNTSGLTHYFHRNFTIHGPGNYYPGTNSTTVFKGTLDQTYERLGGSGNFRNVVVDKTADKSAGLVEVSGGEPIAQVEETDESKALTVNLLTTIVAFSGGTTTIEEGTLNLNGKNYKSTGAMNINAGGKLAVPSGSYLYPNGGLYINNGGILETIGTAGSNARVSHDGASSYYPFEVNSGGTISASYTRFQYMNANGVYIKEGAIVDATHSFHNCTFELGAPAISTLMLIHNNQTFSVNNAVFPNNTWGGQYNVWKMIDSGHVTFNNATGGFAGPTYENDPYNRIDWSGFIPGLWTGTVSANWFTPGNWSDGNVPVAGTNVVIPAGCPYFPVVSGAAAVCNDIDINTGASLTIGNNSLTAAGTVDINGHLVMTNAAAVLNADQIWWNDGSSANVTAGTFNTFHWMFREGTTAKLGTSNTAYIKNLYYPTTDDAEFGNLVVVPLTDFKQNPSEAFYPTIVAGDFTMQTGSAWGMSPGLIVNGNVVLQSGSLLHMNMYSNLTIGGAINLAGELVINEGTALLSGDLSFPATGTLTLNNGNFTCNYSLETGWMNLAGTLNMAGALSVFDITGRNVWIAATFIDDNITGGVIRFGRTLSAASANVFQISGVPVEFTGPNSGHYIQVTNGNYLDNMTINKTGVGISLNNDIIVNGNLNIQGGVLSANDKIITLGGNWNNTFGPAAFNEGTSLVVFNGTGELNNQLINGTTNFYNVSNIKTGGGKLYFMGVTNIANNFIANGVNVVSGPALSVAGLLDLSTGSLTLSSVAPTVTVNNFTMGGDFSVIDGNFTCTDITNDGIYGNIDLYNGNITLNQVGEQYTDLNGNLNISGGTFNVNGTFLMSIWGWSGPASLTMSGGVLNFNNPGVGIFSAHTIATSISGGNIRTPGSFWVTHPNFTPTGGTAELYGNNPVYVQSSGGSHFYNLTIDKPSGLLLGGDLNNEEEQFDAIREHRSQKDRMVCEPPSRRSGNIAYTNGNLKVVNNTVIEEGSLIIEYDASNSGHFTVNEGGKLSLINLGSLAMGDSKALTVNSGGEFSLQGNAIDFPKITRISGNYGLNIESGTAIGAEYAIFEYMNTAGVNVKPGAIVNPAASFTNCIFRNGQSGGRLLTLNNNQTLLMSNVSFPGSSGNFNISKTVDEGVVVLNDYTGTFSGGDYEQDNHNRIHWTGEPSPNIMLDGVIVGSYENFCFEAIENITVGGLQSFVVESFGSANLVAGESILMLPGTHAHSGSYLLAQISDVSFCSGLPLALVAAVDADHTQSDLYEITSHIHQNLFKVYPNPGRGEITLELLSHESARHVVVEVYNLMGQSLMNKVMEVEPQYQIDLTGLQNGVYIIKVTHGKASDFARLIKQ